MKNKLSEKIILFLMTILIIISTVMSISFTVSAASSVGTEEALKNAIRSGGDIKLTKSMELSDMITIEPNTTVSIDLNGKTIDRAVSTVQENGSVIKVEEGATLVITDSSSYPGTITGGAAKLGAGIRNYGTLTIENGNISGNKALDNNEGLGGGIYNGEGGVLNLKGGTVKNNRSRLGSGIYNDTGAIMTVSQGSYKKKAGSVVSTVTTNATITDNKSTKYGGGIYNVGEFNIQDSPSISDNTTDDICLAEDTKITITGTIDISDKISVMALGSDPVITSGFENSGFSDPGDIFRSASTDSVMMLNTDNEVRFRTGYDTTVQTYTKDGLSSSEDFSDVKSAWNKASSYAESGKKTTLILGDDLNHDSLLTIPENSDLTLDLNGHYIKRTRNYEMIKNGEVFQISEGAVFTVTDSNPKRKGYDGLKGGVITGGASTNSAGGIHLEKNSTLNMYGGTIYECVTSEHGGAINASEYDSIINIKDSRIYFCQTLDSMGSCFGGGIFVKQNIKLSLENVSIEDCYSEDSGGGLYAYYEGSQASITLKDVLFSGNKANSSGGAIDILRGKNVSFRADRCTFTGNRATSLGGAVCLSGTDNAETMIFNDCTFRSNYSKNNGSAIYNKVKGTVLTNCTITNNTVDSNRTCGSVFVTKEGNISLGGLTVIKDNKTNNKTHKDLLLERYSDYCASIICSGLEQGSYIAFSLQEDTVNNDVKYTVIKNLSEYQMRYFYPSNGTLTFNKEKNINTPFVTASALNSGSITALLVIGSVFILILTIVLIIRKKRKGEKSDETDT